MKKYQIIYADPLGDLSRVELFARPDSQRDLMGKNTFDGWDVWGNEVKSDLVFFK